MKRNFANIQAMRGIAALLVCLVHSVAMPVSVGMDPVVPFLGAVGPAGVDLFFVISGFIIATVADQAGDKAASRGRFKIAREFALKRVARVYPIYWVVFILAVLVSPYIFLAPSTVPERPLWRLFLLIDTNNNKIMAAWTLVFELYFYLVVGALLLLAPRRIFHGILAWASVTIILLAYFEVTGNPWRFAVPFSPVLIEFMLGTAIAYALKQGVTGHARMAIAAGVLLFAAGAYANHSFGDWRPWHRTIAFGPASALIIYGVVAHELKYGWTFKRPWQQLGDASYSLYIWHQPMFFGMLAISQWLGLFRHLPGIAIVPVWIMIVLGWSMLSFHCLENPLRKWLEGIITGRRGKAVGEDGAVRVRGRPVAAYGLGAMACFLIAFLGLGGYAYSQRSAFASAGQAAQQFEQAMSANRIGLAQAAASLGLLPDGALRSHVDNAGRPMPQTIQLQGWAADTSGKRRPLQIMAYQCGRYLGTVSLRQPRPDVTAVLNIPDDRHGFTDNFAARPECEAGMVEMLILTEDQRFAVQSGIMP
ncbi:acyltransferase family protein [Teichococcus oryzae]|nr:acyltransferase [Pseudoroseomonas oryzae]